VVTERLKASHKAFGHSILAHEIAKISKGSGARFSSNQLYSARCSLPLYDHGLFVIFASFCADPLRAIAAPPRRPRSRMYCFRVPVRSEIGPYQRRQNAPVG
jgi:hypothetical protein